MTDSTQGSSAIPAREQLSREQDLAAQLFRTRDRLRLAELDAEAFHSRVLELERKLREAEDRLADALGELHESRRQLGLALDSAAEQRQHHFEKEYTLNTLLSESEAKHAAVTAMLEGAMQVAQGNALELARVLNSRSWALMRPLRRIVCKLRGVPFAEPRPATVEGMSSPENAPDAGSH
jgi:septal ring factor EnvC (AmiA/AmiB activator)